MEASPWLSRFHFFPETFLKVTTLLLTYCILPPLSKLFFPQEVEHRVAPHDEGPGEELTEWCTSASDWVSNSSPANFSFTSRLANSKERGPILRSAQFVCGNFETANYFYFFLSTWQFRSLVSLTALRTDTPAQRHRGSSRTPRKSNYNARGTAAYGHV